MNDLLESLEAMGRRGGVVALLVSGMALSLAAVAWFDAMDLLSFVDPVDQRMNARWARRGMTFASLMAFAVALPSAFMGVRLLTQRHYPAASEVFPPMLREDIEAALAKRTEHQCVCTRCHIMVPAAFSTGACPVCGSSVEYHEVTSDEDARMVIAAMS